MTGAGSALSSAGLVGAQTKFKKQIERLHVEGHIGAATHILEEATVFFRNPDAPTPARLSLDDTCTRLAELNPPAGEADDDDPSL